MKLEGWWKEKFHKLDTSWTDNHISLKHQYADIIGLRRGVGMKKALSMEKIKLEGFHHRGIDDARNIVKIFLSKFNS